jgi:predicted DsbA family dithiol-disulfide isomerase
VLVRHPQALASDLRLDATAFQACVTGEKHKAQIERDVADAQATGITGTPTFVVGKTATDGLSGIKIVGALPYPVFDARLEELRAGK